MPLSDIAIRNAKPSEKSIKLTDGGGLYLLLKPNGAKWWRLDYRFSGKRKTLSMGVYPEVGLKAARDKRDEARRLLADGTHSQLLPLHIEREPLFLKSVYLQSSQRLLDRLGR